LCLLFLRLLSCVRFGTPHGRLIVGAVNCVVCRHYQRGSIECVIDVPQQEWRKAVTKLLTATAVFLAIGAAAPASAGTSLNGLTMNGLTMNGSTVNGLTMNGLTMNGLTMNALTPNRVALNGATLEDVVATLIEVQLPR